jgi:hypothetical protein
MSIVTLGQVINGSQSNDVLGLNAVSSRAKIIDYINRAIELAEYEANWNVWLGTLDICADCHGIVTLPSFVGTVLAVNVGGVPTWFRNNWYEFHINGVGSGCNPCGGATGWGYFTDDLGFSPVFQDLTDWMYLAAICEDPIDGNGSLTMNVQGITMDNNYNQKAAITIPASGPSAAGVTLTLLKGVAAVDPAVTPFKRILQVTKPVTRGYVKLIAFNGQQLGNAVTLGYYAPNETNPQYRRIRVNQACKWVRVKYRRANLPLVNDYDIVPIPSYQACLDLLKAVRYRDTGDIQTSAGYVLLAVDLLGKIEGIENGPNVSPIQVDPGFGIGSIDFR